MQLFLDQDNAHLLRTIGQSQTKLVRLTHIRVVDMLGLRHTSVPFYLESPVTEFDNMDGSHWSEFGATSREE
jgi:hypothetical protein